MAKITIAHQKIERGRVNFCSAMARVTELLTLALITNSWDQSEERECVVRTQANRTSYTAHKLCIIVDIGVLFCRG